MPEIFLDGESVQFDGPAPASLHELLAAVEPSLAQAGRVLAAVIVDGTSTDGELDAQAYTTARRIELASVTISSATEQIASACRARAAELRDEARVVASVVLREPWPSIVPRVVGLGERLAALTHDLGPLGAIPDFAKASGQLAVGLQAWMDALEARDAAQLCLKLDRAVLPALANLATPGQDEPGGRL